MKNKMITKKWLKIFDKLYKCYIDKQELWIVELKPTQLWQYMFTELFLKEWRYYVCLECNYTSCFNPECYLIDIYNWKKVYWFKWII